MIIDTEENNWKSAGMIVQLLVQADQCPSLITGAATLCAFLWRPGLGMEDPSTELDADVQALAARETEVSNKSFVWC